MPRLEVAIKDPITNRMICRSCRDGDHKKCYLDKNPPAGNCDCAHHEQARSRKKKVDLNLYRDIEEDFGTITIE